MSGFLLVLVSAIMVTVGVALGGHIYAWELLVWAWSSVLWCGVAWHARADRLRR